MKNFFFLFVIFGSLLYAGAIQSDKEFQQAVEKMGKENKLVLMIYSTEDCPECAYMKQKVFYDKAVEPYLTRNFVVIEKNIHKSKLPDGACCGLVGCWSRTTPPLPTPMPSTI